MLESTRAKLLETLSLAQFLIELLESNWAEVMSSGEAIEGVLKELGDCEHLDGVDPSEPYLEEQHSIESVRISLGNAGGQAVLNALKEMDHEITQLESVSSESSSHRHDKICDILQVLKCFSGLKFVTFDEPYLEDQHSFQSLTDRLSVLIEKDEYFERGQGLLAIKEFDEMRFEACKERYLRALMTGSGGKLSHELLRLSGMYIHFGSKELDMTIVEFHQLVVYFSAGRLKQLFRSNGFSHQKLDERASGYLLDMLSSMNALFSMSFQGLELDRPEYKSELHLLHQYLKIFAYAEQINFELGANPSILEKTLITEMNGLLNLTQDHVHSSWIPMIYRMRGHELIQIVQEAFRALSFDEIHKERVEGRVVWSKRAHHLSKSDLTLCMAVYYLIGAYQMREHRRHGFLPGIEHITHQVREEIDFLIQFHPALKKLRKQSAVSESAQWFYSADFQKDLGLQLSSFYSIDHEAIVETESLSSELDYTIARAVQFLFAQYKANWMDRKKLDNAVNELDMDCQIDPTEARKMLDELGPVGSIERQFIVLAHHYKKHEALKILTSIPHVLNGFKFNSDFCMATDPYGFLAERAKKQLESYIKSEIEANSIAAAKREAMKAQVAMENSSGFSPALDHLSLDLKRIVEVPSDGSDYCSGDSKGEVASDSPGTASSKEESSAVSSADSPHSIPDLECRKAIAINLDHRLLKPEPIRLFSPCQLERTNKFLSLVGDQDDDLFELKSAKATGRGDNDAWADHLLSSDDEDVRQLPGGSLLFLGAAARSRIKVNVQDDFYTHLFASQSVS